LLPPERLDIALAPGTTPESRLAILTPSPRWRRRVDGVRHG
jgi:hypothetical protein